MIWLDWLVLLGTLLFIVLYGTWKTRQQRDLQSYLLGGREAGWLTVGLSVMATQASAITFLSTPGQAFESGMGFLQFYFGLPLAIVILSITFIPIYYRLKVYTAYEYLEQRYDLRMRLLTAFLFLVQRGLAAGITIYAPAIVLSTVMGWDLNLTNIVIGLLVIVYTVSGGSKAVNLTQKWQMTVIMGGMFLAFFMLLKYISPFASFGEALDIAGFYGKLEVVNFRFDPNERYTIWSGLTGGLFLAMSYFGTDQSQVQRYLSASSLKQSRMGLIFNAVLKIPMQFFILFTGVLVFVFYLYYERPVHFNKNHEQRIEAAGLSEEAGEITAEFNQLAEERKDLLTNGTSLKENALALKTIEANQQALKDKYNELVVKADPEAETRDSDYVFIRFVLDYLPHGVIGLLLAVILCAAMSSTAGELNALASTTMVDFYKRLNPSRAISDAREVMVGKFFTVLWGVAAISFALLARLFDNLIELVNILGSLFYGTILGIFLCAFYFKAPAGKHVFIAALVAETLVLSLFFTTDIGFLWFNAIGCFAVILVAYAAYFLDRSK